MTRVLVAAALLGVGGGTLAACGDGDEESAPEGFVAEADAACTDGAERLAEHTTDLGAPLEPTQSKDYLPEQIEISEEVLAGLEDAGDEADQEAARPLIENHGKQVDTLDELLRRAETIDINVPDQIHRFHRVEDEYDALAAEGRRIAADLDLMACAGELSPDQADELEATITDIFTRGDPAHCTEDYTDNYVERQAGPDGLCEELERTLEQAKSVEIVSKYGVDDISASALIVLPPIADEPERAVLVNFIREDDRWKLDSTFDVPLPTQGNSQ